MDINEYIEYIDSMHPATEKERKKLQNILRGYSVYDDNESGIREIHVPKGFYIPFRNNLYSWHDLMIMAEKKKYYERIHEQAALVEDEYGLLWLKIHCHDSAYDDDLFVFFPVEDDKEAYNLYEFELRDIRKYFWDFPEDKLVIPHFRFNDGPLLYLVTDDRSISKEDMFDLLITSNVML